MDNLKIKNHGFALIVIAALLLCQVLYADTYGPYDLTEFGEVWNISGTYTEDESIEDALGGEFDVDSVVSYTLTQDAKGKITGYGTATVTVYDVYGYDITIDMDFNITGSVKQSRGVCTVAMNMKCTGTAEIEGYVFPFKGSEMIKATLDSVSAIMEGSVKVCLTVKGAGTISETTLFSLAVADEFMDGSAEVEFEADANGKNLIGTGTVILSNNDEYSFAVKGKCNTKNNTSCFTLKGTGSANGSSLKITLDGDDDISCVKGKLLGQSIK